MRKVTVLLLVSAVTFLTAFAVTAYAGTSLFASGPAHPDVSSLPVFAAPAISLTPDQRVSLGNLIPSNSAARVGISSDSFDEVRAFSVGDQKLYVVPGSSGVCVILGNGGTCGDPASVGQIGVVAIHDGSVTGAGVTAADINSFVETVNHTAATIVPHNGMFTLEDAGLHVPTGARPQISVHS